MECEETRSLCRMLEARPISAVTYPLVGGTHVPKGWPDRFIAVSYSIYQFSGHIEFKKGTNRVSALQIRRIRDLLDRGHFACAVWIGDKNTDYSYVVREYLSEGREHDTRVYTGGIIGLLEVLHSAYEHHLARKTME